jgi:hypothetical protein
MNKKNNINLLFYSPTPESGINTGLIYTIFNYNIFSYIVKKIIKNICACIKIFYWFIH